MADNPAQQRRDLKDLRQWYKTLGELCTESGHDDLITAIASGGTSQQDVTMLRASIGDLYGVVADQRHEMDVRDRALKEHADKEKTIHADIEHRLRQEIFAIVRDASTIMRSEVRGLLYTLKERGESDPLAGLARRVLLKFDTEPEPGSTERMLADLHAARDRLSTEKTRYWNAIYEVRAAHSEAGHDRVGEGGRCAVCAVLRTVCV